MTWLNTMPSLIFCWVFPISHLKRLCCSTGSWSHCKNLLLVSCGRPDTRLGSEGSLKWSSINSTQVCALHMFFQWNITTSVWRAGTHQGGSENLLKNLRKHYLKVKMGTGYELNCPDKVPTQAWLLYWYFTTPSCAFHHYIYFLILMDN